MTFSGKPVFTGMMKHLLLLLLLAAPLAQCAQPIMGKSVAHDRTGEDFGRYVLDKFQSECLALLANGVNEFFTDSSLKTPLPDSAERMRFHIPRSYQIINPMNPDDPYDLIDTLIPELFPINQWAGLSAGQGYLKLQTLLRSDLYIPVHSFGEASVARVLYQCLIHTKTEIRGYEFPIRMRAYLDDLQWEIYRAGFDKSLTAYFDPRCRQADSLGYWFADICVTRHNNQITNPVNPGDPYDLIDTVITEPPLSGSFTGFEFCSVSTPPQSATWISFGLTCKTGPSHQSYNGKPTQIQPQKESRSQFWMKPEDLIHSRLSPHYPTLRLLYYWNLLHPG